MFLLLCSIGRDRNKGKVHRFYHLMKRGKVLDLTGLENKLTVAGAGGRTGEAIVREFGTDMYTMLQAFFNNITEYSTPYRVRISTVL